MINQSKDGFVVAHVLLSMFNHYNKMSLAINIVVQRIDINRALIRCLKMC